MPDSDDIVHCWRCDYDLSGRHEDEVCPECGLLVSIARQQVAPLVIGSRAQKWVGVCALLSFVPFLLLGLVFHVAANFAPGGPHISSYWGFMPFVFASIAGSTAGWCMHVPKLPSSEFSYASMVLCATLFLFGLIKILGEGVLDLTWSILVNHLFLIVMMCALGTLSLQAKMLARRMGMDTPAKHTPFFGEISSLAFVSAGLIALGILTSAVRLVPLTSTLPGRLLGGCGVLLGILALISWMQLIIPIVGQFARWPIGESPKPLHI